MVKNERGGVGIKTTRWLPGLPLWQVGQIIYTNTSRKVFFLSGVFTGIPQNEPCTFKVHHQPSPEQLWKEDLGLGWASPVATELPSPKVGQGERKSCKSRQRHDPTRGGEERLDASPWGIWASISLTLTHSHTHMLPIAVSWPSSHLLCPHLLSDSQNCGAIYKTPPGPLTGSRRRVMGPSLDCGPLGGADQPSSSCRITLNPYNTLWNGPASPPSLSSAFNRRGTWGAERAWNWSAVTVSGMRTLGPRSPAQSVCSKPREATAVPHSLPDCTSLSLAPVHRLQDCAGSAASAPGQVLTSPWALGFPSVQ